MEIIGQYYRKNMDGELREYLHERLKRREVGMRKPSVFGSYKLLDCVGFDGRRSKAR